MHTRELGSRLAAEGALARLRQLETARKHPGHAHFWDRALSRRQFLRGAGAAGLLLGAGAALPARAGAPPAGVPKPIPGGFQIFGPGTEVFHTFAPGYLDPIDTDRSTIFDFVGQVAYAVIRGEGTGRDTMTGETTRLLFEVDLRAIRGVYVDSLGHYRFGTFAFQ
jgi:hypothetical protein